MRKIVMGILACLCAVSVMADSYTYTYSSAGIGTNLSDAIPISGWLDKIELSNGTGAAATTTVVVATYDGTTAIDTLVTKAVTTPVVVRLRVQPTDNTGTVIPAVAITGAETNVTTLLTVPYGPVLVGGNIKISTINVHSTTTNENKIVFYYEPLKR